jgi:transposase
VPQPGRGERSSPPRDVNRFLGSFFARRVKTDKPKTQATGVRLRKLVMLCYGVLKNRAPFDPK